MTLNTRFDVVATQKIIGLLTTLIICSVYSSKQFRWSQFPRDLDKLAVNHVNSRQPTSIGHLFCLGLLSKECTHSPTIILSFHTPHGHLVLLISCCYQGHFTLKLKGRDHGNLKYLIDGKRRHCLASFTLRFQCKWNQGSLNG